MDNKINWSRIEKSLASSIKVLHEELGWFNNEELQNTPRRIKDFYKEWVGNKNFNFTMFTPSDIQVTKSLVILKNIKFYSMCSHHMLPFIGSISVAYLPREGGRICGISKLARTVVKFASKPQIQEVMTNEIADFLFKKLDAWFVMVIVKGVHLCMVMRGVKQQNAEVVTSAIRWDKNVPLINNNFQNLKDEVLKLINS